MERCKCLETPWTLQLRDPLANSFVSSVLEDPRKDPRMQVCAFTSAAIKGENITTLCAVNVISDKHVAFAGALAAGNAEDALAKCIMPDWLAKYLVRTTTVM